jgi:hypothetical protein
MADVSVGLPNDRNVSAGFGNILCYRLFKNAQMQGAQNHEE